MFVFVFVCVPVCVCVCVHVWLMDNVVSAGELRSAAINSNMLLSGSCHAAQPYVKAHFLPASSRGQQMARKHCSPDRNSYVEIAGGGRDYESDAVRRETTDQLEDLRYQPHVLGSITLNTTSVGIMSCDTEAARSGGAKWHVKIHKQIVMKIWHL